MIHIENELFGQDDYDKLVHLVDIDGFGNLNMNSWCNRYEGANDSLYGFGESLVGRARDIFESESLIHTYSFYVKYIGQNANMKFHVDDNACTYTIDYCFRQKFPWPIYVNGQQFNLFTNQALFFKGEEQWHGRYRPDDNKVHNEVEMMFFHYAEPDHWWFEKNEFMREEKREKQKLKRQRRTEMYQLKYGQYPTQH